MNAFHRWYCHSGRWRRVVQHDLVPWVTRDIKLGSRVLELGPGPGLTTEVLAKQVNQLVAVEIDTRSVERLQLTLKDADNVEVIQGDATDLTFDDESFSAALCFTMLHHVPSTEMQDRLLSEAHRILIHGGTFAGSDSTTSAPFRAAHLFDTMVLVDPDQFGARLERAGFENVLVDRASKAFRFRARKP